LDEVSWISDELKRLFGSIPLGLPDSPALAGSGCAVLRFAPVPASATLHQWLNTYHPLLGVLD